MPTAALLRSFPALAKLVLHGTFPRLGAFRPDDVQTEARSSVPYPVIHLSCREGWVGKAACDTLVAELFATCLGVACSRLQSAVHQTPEAEQPHSLAESHSVACGPTSSTTCSNIRACSRLLASDGPISSNRLETVGERRPKEEQSRVCFFESGQALPHNHP